MRKRNHHHKIFLGVILIGLMIIGSSTFIGCAGEDKSVDIGIVLPLTGNIASYGRMAEKGIKLAAEEWDATGKMKIRLMTEDNKSTSKDAVSAMSKLINVQRVPVIIGGIASSIALAEAPLANKNETVLMCTFASSPRITNAGEYVFRVMPSDAFQGELLAERFIELKYNKVAIIYVRNDWGEALKDVFVSNFNKLGGEIILIESCGEGQSDLRGIIAKINQVEDQIDVVFVPTYAKEGGIFLRQAKEARIMKPIFGADPWANKELVEIAGAAAEGVRFIAPLQYEGKEFKILADKFVKIYDEKPDLTASAGYDATNLILSIIEKIIIDNNKVTGKNIREYLLKVTDYIGATGNTTFDENGDVISKEFAERIIRDGQIETINNN